MVHKWKVLFSLQQITRKKERNQQGNIEIHLIHVSRVCPCAYPSNP